ncbi:MAG: hypothetical protein HY905_07200 [Deltaproteobacteria bacterium]|nr:hypothetical protein [Deltaproteobacteria bacterium]
MGRIIKEFIAEACGARATRTGKIDGGADRTVLKPDVAEELRLDTRTAQPHSVWTASGQEVMGHIFRVRLTVDQRTAEVDAFVPVGAVSTSGELESVQPRNLIGTDFLQASQAKCDYSKPHEEVFSGVPQRDEIGGGWIDFDPPKHLPRRGTGPCKKRRR